MNAKAEYAAVATREGSAEACRLVTMACLFVATSHLFAHDLSEGGPHAHRYAAARPDQKAISQLFLAHAETQIGGTTTGGTTAQTSPHPVQATSFERFAPAVKVRWDDRFLYVENNGIPAHGMMIGITAWQQQVPIPQAYLGENAWRIPLHPVPALKPVSIKNRFLRGAIAVAANGIPIFNPQNNRGEISQQIGELDQWGGHCGRADDYHYHAAPIHLQSVVGKGRPIAFALDGYPIFGTTEPDDSAAQGLDSFNGHTTAALGYHYHASTKYPYVNGGFHGEVTEREGQVDPQPRAQPVRPDLQPLRGAKITGFEAAADQKHFKLDYTVQGQSASVQYQTDGTGNWTFQFLNFDGTRKEETYRAGLSGGRGGGGRNGPDGDRGRRPRRDDSGGPARENRGERRESSSTDSSSPDWNPKRSGRFSLSSPSVPASGMLPVEFTGDGAGISPPLLWKGEPSGTRSYALIMHHMDRENQAKCYWILQNIPASTHELAKGARAIGTEGRNSINGESGYAPPHSKGPGEKTYILTLYALSEPVKVDSDTAKVSRRTLLEAIQETTLDSAELQVTYSRAGSTAADERREK